MTNLAATLTELSAIALHLPAESISAASVATVICGNEFNKARWDAHCPNGLLPVTRVPVQVLVVQIYEVAS